ncbi:CFF_collapsed_G0023200.mRNA.1.CDS.1 [Saccharomyces cerevisiae]|nr:CFF_collapsed_G0023200.mRNA.1.CDS.1 [Saccharomyces cerevisiae]
MMLKEELRKELLILRCLYHPTIQILLPTLGTAREAKKKEKYALSLFEPILNCGVRENFRINPVNLNLNPRVSRNFQRSAQ